MAPRRIFVVADHGLALVYFLQSDVVPTLLDRGVEVIVLTDDALVERLQARFGRPGVRFEGLRLDQARAYFRQHHYRTQWWLDFLRRAGASNRIPLGAVESYIQQVAFEAHGRRKAVLQLMRAYLALMRRYRWARQAVVRAQWRFTPNIYEDLFERYRPDLVVASTPGWRLDRYLLREARFHHGVPTAAVIVGWDNTSSYSLPGAPVQALNVWSAIQKREAVEGSDWDPARIHIGGIPSYDGYYLRKWVLPRAAYFQRHGLDPNRKLIAYAASFVTFSPNYQNIEALARLVAEDRLAYPAQLLIRLHPNHFLDVPHFAAERERIYALARELPHVHVVQPVPLGGSLGYYSGEDMDEKSSMMAHADVFTTVYSTMVVETAIHDTPVVSVCIDAPEPWPGKFTLKLSEIGHWPTHSRFLRSGAGEVAYNEVELQAALNRALEAPDARAAARRAFVARETTYTDGSAGRRVGQWLANFAKA
ncbi:MAG: hypothetical protein GXO36_06405 [Chloroflexi bacterium]|nr:hypothetical protein [Chloroflexota bacterium]